MGKIKLISDEVYQRLRSGTSIAEIILIYSLSVDDWYRLSCLLYEKYKSDKKTEIAKDYPGQDHSDIFCEVNSYLSDYALAFPTLGTAGKLKKIHSIIKSDKANKIDIVFNEFNNIIMGTNIRALAVEAYYSETMLNEGIHNIFYEFNYIIDSASVSFYRGNLVSALITIMPVIEGILLRWQGFPDRVTTKPSFEESIKYLSNIKARQPFPANVLYFDSWHKACLKIIREHLFKSTESGRTLDDFNRHLILHLLDDSDFCTPINVMRCFLLIDIMFELYLAENRITNFKINAKHGFTTIESTKTFLAYNDALSQYVDGRTPEYSLYKHEKCKKLL
jgi:hypothetical protein